MKIIHANIYAHNQQVARDLDWLASQHATVVGINEGYNVIARLRAIKGYRCFVNPNPGRGQQDCPILLRQSEGVRVISSGSVQATEPATPIKIAPARFIEWIRYQRANGDRWMHIDTHLNAALQGHDGKPLTGTKRVRQAIKHMRLLQKMVRQAHLDGFKVTISGDFNYRDFPRVAGFVFWYWSPQRTFRRLGLDFVNEGLDYIAFPSSYIVEDKTIIPASQTGSDHPWIVLTIRHRRSHRIRSLRDEVAHQ